MKTTVRKSKGLLGVWQGLSPSTPLQKLWVVLANVCAKNI